MRVWQGMEYERICVLDRSQKCRDEGKVVALNCLRV